MIFGRKSLTSAAAAIGAVPFLLAPIFGDDPSLLGVGKVEVLKAGGISAQIPLQPSDPSKDPVYTVDDVFAFLGCEHAPPGEEIDANNRPVGNVADGEGYCSGIYVIAYYTREDADATFSTAKRDTSWACRKNEGGYSFYKTSNVVIVVSPTGEIATNGTRVHYDVESMTRKILQLQPTDEFKVVC